MKDIRISIILLICFALDLISKQIATTQGWVQINTDGIFGWQLNWGRDFGLINFLMVMVLLWFFKVSQGWNIRQKLFGGMIIIAGISNLLDRLIWGGVRDWLSLPGTSIVNNLADWWLTIGVIGLFVMMWLDRKSYNSSDEN